MLVFAYHRMKCVSIIHSQFLGGCSQVQSASCIWGYVVMKCQSIICCKIKLKLLIFRKLLWILMYMWNEHVAAQPRGLCQQLSQEDGECEVIIVDENNSSILADPDTHSSGPPSLKVGREHVVLCVVSLLIIHGWGSLVI